MPNNYVGIVLAGGESKRYGVPKALEKMDDTLFYEKAIQVLKPLVDHIVVVSHPSIINHIIEQKGVTVILDEHQFQGAGPLAGIYSGMTAMQASHYLVLACDMPLMGQQIFDQLTCLTHFMNQNSSVVPIAEHRSQPLAALYSSSIRTVIRELLRVKKRRMTDLLGQIDCAYIEYTSNSMVRCFKNVNTPKDYAEINF